MSLLTNLTAYYKLDGNHNDASGNGHTGTDTAIMYDNTYGKINQGALFNGSTSHIDCGTFATPLSVSFWFNIPTITGAEMDMFTKWGVTVNGIVCGLTILGKPMVFFANNAENLTATSAVSTSAWHHFVYVNKIDGTNSVIYLDGAQVATTAGASALTDNTNHVNIGDNAGSGGSNFFAGDIDEVGCWSRALTTAEIAQLYNFGAGNQYPFNNLYWVGGTGTWDSSTQTHWAATSGGTGGIFGVPGSSNSSVNFDANSGGGTVTLTTSPTTPNINMTGYTGTITPGSNTITLTGTGVVWTGGGIYNPGSSTIVISDTSSSSKTFAGNSLNYYNLTFTGGTGVHVISGSNTFNGITITTPPSTINFTAGTTTTLTTANFNVSGTAGNLNTLQSTSNGSAWNIQSTQTISIDYVSLQDSHVT